MRQPITRSPHSKEEVPQTSISEYRYEIRLAPIHSLKINAFILANQGHVILKIAYGL